LALRRKRISPTRNRQARAIFARVEEGIMGQEIIEETPEIWGKSFSTESETVERDYDKFAEAGDYDGTFAEWGYVGPETAAAIARNFVPLSSRILDAACGSGLTGVALKHLGYTTIHGIDISSALLKLAEKTGAYASLHKVDMQALPLPIADESYDAVTFIGALTYFETNDILKELCRIVRPKGHIVFSQRDDIMRDRDYGKGLRELEELGLWKRVFGTEPMPYLPKHPEYGTDIQVQYFVYRVL
jgi:SAM-dependent methyltransferase